MEKGHIKEDISKIISRILMQYDFNKTDDKADDFWEDANLISNLENDKKQSIYRKQTDLIVSNLISLIYFSITLFYPR